MDRGRSGGGADEPSDVSKGVLGGVEHDREKVDHVHRVKVAVVRGEPPALDEHVAVGVRGRTYLFERARGLCVAGSVGAIADESVRDLLAARHVDDLAQRDEGMDEIRTRVLFLRIAIVAPTSPPQTKATGATAPILHGAKFTLIRA